MKIFELEKALNTEFPEKFHDMCSSGDMEWLENSSEEFSLHRNKYINNPDSFLMLNCDCEPILFENIPESIEDLNELIGYQEEDEDKEFNDEFKLIPFAKTAGGDYYCFAYNGTDKEPVIILYLHDEYDNPEIIAYSFEEFIYVQMLSAACDEDLDGEHWKHHLEYLSPEHKSKIAGKNADELSEEYESIENDTLDIWK